MNNCRNVDTGVFEHWTNKKKMRTTIFGKAAIFFQCRMMNVPQHTKDEFETLLRKKMQRSLPERQTEGKNRCLRLPRHTGNPQLKYGKARATTAWKTKSTRTPSLVSPYEKTGDSRFAPNLLPYTGVRAVFLGSREQLWERSYRPYILSRPKTCGIESRGECISVCWKDYSYVRVQKYM